jgi:hypothetical protein
MQEPVPARTWVWVLIVASLACHGRTPLGSMTTPSPARICVLVVMRVSPSSAVAVDLGARAGLDAALDSHLRLPW